MSTESAKDPSPSSPSQPPRRPRLPRVFTLTSLSPEPSTSALKSLVKVRSFDHLILLAQDPAFQRQATKIVWRPHGERHKELRDWRQIARHAGLGAWRAGTLAFCIRAGVNLVLMLFRAYRTRRLCGRMLLHALLGEDTWRFGLMMGSFVGLYKFLLNSLPLLRLRFLSNIPRSPTSASSKDSGADDEDVRPTRVDAALAGAISSLALLFEKRHRRLVIGQQVFVRGLQALTSAHNLSIPHGAVLIFGLACGQIMYAFLLRPETIPRGYVNWIQSASRIRTETVMINRTLVREGRFDPEQLRVIKDWKGTTPHNRSFMEGMLERAAKGHFGPRFSQCELTHPWIDSCMDVPLDRFLSVAQWMAPVYTALHFIPAILFRPKRFASQPLTSIVRTALSTARSCSFLGIFVVIYQSWFCLKHNLALVPNMPPLLKCFFASRFSFWLGGFMTSASLFAEEPKRRAELAMYVLPRGLESAWRTLRSRRLVVHIPGGENLLAAIGLAMVMNTYQHDPEHLSRLVRAILYQFIGPN